MDMSVWSGRIDAAEGELAKRWHQSIQPLSESGEAGIAILGFNCDEGVKRNQGRVGAANAPKVLRKALANLAHPPQKPLWEAGDITCVNGNLEQAHIDLAQQVRHLQENKHFSLVLGGGHETAYGHFVGLQEAWPEHKIGIVNLDAHFDLRMAEQASSGTPFAQIAHYCADHQYSFNYMCLGVAEPSNTAALFQSAEKLGVKWRLDKEMTVWEHAQTLMELQQFMDSVDKVYLTIDLDVLPASQMPAVSAPAGRGVDISIIESIIENIAQSNKLIAADLVEFNPDFDIDHHGAKTAARLAWSIVRNLNY